MFGVEIEVTQWQTHWRLPTGYLSWRYVIHFIELFKIIYGYGGVLTCLPPINQVSATTEPDLRQPTTPCEIPSNIDIHMNEWLNDVLGKYKIACWKWMTLQTVWLIIHISFMDLCAVSDGMLFFAFRIIIASISHVRFVLIMLLCSFCRFSSELYSIER